MRFVFDIETDGLIPELTKIHCIELIHVETGTAYSFTPDNVQAGLDMLEKANEIIGHNIIGFDIPAIQKLKPDWNPQGKVTDTLVLSQLLKGDIKNSDFDYDREYGFGIGVTTGLPKRLCGSHSLKAWGYRLNEHKEEIQTDWKVWTPEMQKYCAQDVAVNHKLFNHFDTLIKDSEWSQDSIDLEHQAAELCYRIGNNGWSFDEKKAGKLYAELAKERSILDTELQTLFEPWEVSTWFTPKVNNKRYGYEKGVPFEKKKPIEFNPQSRRHIERCLKEKYGWKPKKMTNGGHAQIDETILGALHYPEAKKLARMFLLNKRLGQLAEGKQAWLKLADKDGRIRHQIVPCGTVTGRAAHRRPNLGQVPRASAPFGKQCRDLFTVPEGYSLLGSDLSGIELRILAHYLSFTDGGAYAKQILKGDIHTFNQKAAGLETRDQAKTYIYALCYGAGDAMMGKIVGGNAKDGKKLKEKFFKSMPAFQELQNGVQGAVSRGWLKSIDGRRVRLRSAHSALNALLQSAAGCVSKRWICLIDEELKARGLNKDCYMVAWVHDEVQIAVKEGLEDYVGHLTGSCAKKVGEEFNIQIPIESEFSFGKTWADSH